ncbi:MAG: hypothetical protein AAB037_06390 [Chloroflexota bacterium]
MTAVYDVTILLSVALLVIIITVFVLSVTLLGRALESARVAAKEAHQKEKENLVNSLTQLEQRLKAAEQKGDLIEDIKRQIEEHEKERKAIEKKAKTALRDFELLKVRGCVLYPGVLLLFASALATGARLIDSTTDTAIFTFDLSGIALAIWALWLLSAATLLGGLFRIYEVLEVIEKVAVTGGEAQFQKQVEALKMALYQHEEGKRPVLEFEFIDNQLPFTLKPGIEGEVRYHVRLTQGDVAHNTEVWFYAPKGFDFTGKDTWHQEEDFVPSRALTCKEVIATMLRGIWQRRTLKIKPPTEEDEYLLSYRLFCEGFQSDRMEFKVKVAK